MEFWGVFKGQMEEEFEIEIEKERQRDVREIQKGLVSQKLRKGIFEDGDVSYYVRYSRRNGEIVCDFRENSVSGGNLS